MLGVKVPDVAVWQMVKSGELNGFSLDGSGVRVPVTPELEMPALLKGETEPALDGHEHGFVIRFAGDGALRGGETTPGPTAPAPGARARLRTHQGSVRPV